MCVALGGSWKLRLVSTAWCEHKSCGHAATPLGAHRVGPWYCVAMCVSHFPDRGLRNASFVPLMPNSHPRRRRDSAVELSRVGGVSVNWILPTTADVFWSKIWNCQDIFFQKYETCGLKIPHFEAKSNFFSSRNFCRNFVVVCQKNLTICLPLVRSTERDGKWVVAYAIRGEGQVWLIGAVVCLLAANRGFNCLLVPAKDGRMVRCGIIISYQWVATSEIVKAVLATSLSHVRSDIASTGLYLFSPFS